MCSVGPYRRQSIRLTPIGWRRSCSSCAQGMRIVANAIRRARRPFPARKKDRRCLLERPKSRMVALSSTCSYAQLGVSRQVSEVLCRNLAHTFAFAGAGDLRARSCGRYCGRRWPRSELRACPPPMKRDQDKVMIPSRSLSLLCQTVSRFSTCETTDSLRNGGFLAHRSPQGAKMRQKSNSTPASCRSMG